MVLESLARIVKVQLPAYLKRLPLPESVGGFIRLTGRDWCRCGKTTESSCSAFSIYTVVACSQKNAFPVCDGSHNKHNELTGDNVGPLILKKKEV
ncbi:Cisd2 [Columba livia]|nr:Cisd2 [Columba livia]